MLSRPIRAFKVSLICNNRNNTIGKFIQFTFTSHLMLPTFSLECLIKCNHVSEKRTFINDFLKHYCSHFPDFSSAKRCICGCNIKKKKQWFSLFHLYLFPRERCESWKKLRIMKLYTETFSNHRNPWMKLSRISIKWRFKIFHEEISTRCLSTVCALKCSGSISVAEQLRNRPSSDPTTKAKSILKCVSRMPGTNSRMK